MQATAGWSHKICTSCGVPQYPQMSPVCIALVENQSHSQALLVRQPRHPPGMFSCLAGFIDMGKTHVGLAMVIVDNEARILPVLTLAFELPL